ncbi:hypothetical protein [Radiobacillus deserti]|uniref:hypothetical protein n=1 Tax=Radiobacillus deserti TaxID=2594883 RepID=UPI0013159599|nr:hypothetical protein [Radiobacillus deserti]
MRSCEYCSSTSHRLTQHEHAITQLLQKMAKLNQRLSELEHLQQPARRTDYSKSPVIR